MKLYVGNLKYNMSDQQLNALFAPFGEVLSSRIITDQYTRQSKNMGYVEMSDREEGKEAVARLNGKKINNRHIVVKRA